MILMLTLMDEMAIPVEISGDGARRVRFAGDDDL